MSFSAVFQVVCEVEFGTEVNVVGSSDALGRWDLAKSVRLRTSETTYPVWHSSVVSEALDESTEFKYVIVRPGKLSQFDDEHVRWEPIPNRLIELSVSCAAQCVLVTSNFADTGHVLSYPVLKSLPQHKQWDCHRSRPRTLVTWRRAADDRSLVRSVDVLGTFTEPPWNVRLPMFLCVEAMTWWLVLEDALAELNAGVHECKFIINGNTWVTSPDMQMTDCCHENNLVEISVGAGCGKCSDPFVEAGTDDESCRDRGQSCTPSYSSFSTEPTSSELSQFESEADVCSMELLSHLVAGAFYRPKDSAGVGEDASFAAAPYTLGVADGVGGLFPSLGHTSKPFADELMHLCSVAATKRHSCKQCAPASSIARDILREGFDKGLKNGASTAVVAHLDGTSNRLGIAVLGDSAAFVVRMPTLDGNANTTERSTIVFKSPLQQHGFNYPYQLCRLPQRLWRVRDQFTQDKPADCLSFDVDVEDGDLVLLVTDGVVDNLHDEDILTLCDGMISPSFAKSKGLQPSAATPAEAVANSIGMAAYRRSLDTTTRTPFDVEAENFGESRPRIGGKKDDITCLAAWVSTHED